MLSELKIEILFEFLPNEKILQENYQITINIRD